jgi:hypothetical protein
MIGAIDLEIFDQIDDFTKWRDHRPLSISVVAVKLGEEGEGVFYDREHRALQTMGATAALGICLDWLEMGNTLVTHNGFSFDFVVLGDAAKNLPLAKKVAWHPGHVDICFNMFMRLGHGVGLGTICKETIGRGKLEQGTMAVELWHQGEYRRVIDYCREDADLSASLYGHLLSDPIVRWRTRSGHGASRQAMPKGKWSPILSIEEAIRLPPPGVKSFMRNPPTLGKMMEVWDEV